MANRKQFGQLSRASRDRATRQAVEQFGLTRRQARERYNRGTYNPFARDPVDRIPKNPTPRQPDSPEFLEDLRDRAMANLDRQLDLGGESGDYINRNRFTVLDAVYNHASYDALLRMANASEDEIRGWAAHNKDKRKWYPPKWLENLGWTDSDGEWHNVFWYH